MEGTNPKNKNRRVVETKVPVPTVDNVMIMEEVKDRIKKQKVAEKLKNTTLSNTKDINSYYPSTVQQQPRPFESTNTDPKTTTDSSASTTTDPKTSTDSKTTSARHTKMTQMTLDGQKVTLPPQIIPPPASTAPLKGGY